MVTIVLPIDELAGSEVKLKFYAPWEKLSSVFSGLCPGLPDKDIRGSFEVMFFEQFVEP